MSSWLSVIAVGGALLGSLVVLAAATQSKHEADAMLSQYQEMLRAAREARRPPPRDDSR